MIQITPPRAALQALDVGGDLGRDLGRVRRARDEHELRVRVELLGRVEQVREPLLPRDPADEHDRRPRRVDPVALERGRRRVGRYSSVSIPLWITVTRAGSIAG